MKKSLLFAIAICTVLFVKAQIPNPGFENWTTVGSYEDPDGWGTLNSTTSALSVLTVTKGTPGNPGNSYIKLTAKSLGAFGVIPGITVTGVIDPTSQTVTGGFPYTQRPASLDGSFQHMATGTGGGILIWSWHWNSGLMTRDTICAGYLPLSGMAMSWTNFSVPLVYVNSGNPDSCMILMVTSNPAVANDYLWVDDLHFTFPSGIQNTAATTPQISLYPNPAHGKLNVFAGNLLNANCTMQVVDVTGKLMIEKTEHVFNQNLHQTIDISSLQAGLYIFNMKQGDAIETKTFVIE